MARSRTAALIAALPAPLVRLRAQLARRPDTEHEQAIVRMVDIEMSGTYREPDASEIIRTGGDPQSGSCTLGSGATVSIY